MRSLQRALGTRNPAGANRVKAESTVGRCGHAAIPAKARLERFFLCVYFVSVFAVGIRLPDLDQSVRNGLPISIQDRAFEGDPLSRGL